MSPGEPNASPTGNAPTRRRVAVTGLGWVCALGSSRSQALGVLGREPSQSPAPVFDPHGEGIPVPPAPLFTVPEGCVEAALAKELGGKSTGELGEDAELRLAAAAARLAVEDARAQGLLDAATLVLTYEAPGLDRLLRGLFRDFVQAEPPAVATPADIFSHLYNVHKVAAYETHSFLHLHSLAKWLGIHGTTHFLNNACASGLYALDAAARSVADGSAEIAVAVAAESPRFPAKRLWFTEGGLHSTDGWARPFDRDRTGLILGEGSAACVLEPLDAALARGVNPSWEYLGSGFNQEGWKVTIPNFAEPYHERAIRDALVASRMSSSDVDVLVAHGAGTHLSDAYESRGISAVFGDWPMRPQITALKGSVGHTLGASALLETALVLSCLEAGFLPGAAGFVTPDPRLHVKPIAHPTESSARTVLKVSNGLAGFNAASIFRRLPT